MSPAPPQQTGGSICIPVARSRFIVMRVDQSFYPVIMIAGGIDPNKHRSSPIVPWPVPVVCMGGFGVRLLQQCRVEFAGREDVMGAVAVGTAHDDVAFQHVQVMVGVVRVTVNAQAR